jgi:hypothetical protein
VSGLQGGVDQMVLGLAMGQLAFALKQTNDLAGSAEYYGRCLEIFEQTDGPKRCVQRSTWDPARGCGERLTLP